ncbi:MULTISPECIES: type II CRISPR RNA-guided endonuclease Cas9 [unclassified Sulfurospirillum]|uniref:type II CRISPR RNA-guided endonuclease Cas9 n=1 Tax=unclassified Sulfurospirillum TaxID=2618290 RepID=UPI000505216A|nr:MULTISPECIES: type II CRISPR RNA-guided endonuclease Cas9 [unclassified Sulfurospirillum]KFL34573.1 hypothetical protein JU57_04510 [Sulfurospirillum sp. SCADC]
MVEKILGIDLGISSLGWAVVEYDKDNDENNKIIDCGVRLFTAAETPKEKESPNKARRDARGLRRVIKRRRVRMNTIKNLLITYKLIDKTLLDEEMGMFHSQSNRVDVWKLRHDALYHLLSGDELARVLIHIAKHRGYKFLGDDESDEESGKVKKAGAELKKKFLEAGCQSVGEWLWKERGLQGKKRNKSGDYEISIPRDFLVEEIQRIFETQQKFGSTFATSELQKAYTDIAFYVKPMQSIEDMVGYCTFYPKIKSKNQDGEKRAPKASPSAEQFVILSKIFSTIVIDENKQEKKLIELKSIEQLIQIARSKETLKYKQLRKELNLAKDISFKSISDEEKTWINLVGNAKFKKILGLNYETFLKNTEISDEIAKILTYDKTFEQKETKLKNLLVNIDWIDNNHIAELAKLSFSQFNQLSLKAIKIISKIMIEGYARYDEAVQYAFENNLLPKPSHEKSILLPPLKETNIAILNPTVIRAFAQFRQVANALVSKYGSFDKVHFELAREVNTKEDRKRWEKDRDKNEKMHRQITEKLVEEGVKPSYKNILKSKLRSEQKDTCPYCQKNLHYPMIFEDGYAEIDHILPLSQSQDDSYVNKVLVHSACNQNKKNRTPFEWFQDEKKDWDTFKSYILMESTLGEKKRNYLIKENFSDPQSRKEFISRNLNDTRYMSKAIKTYCENHWKLSHDDDKLRIQVRSGKLTSTLRHQWGLDNKNRETHTHHAMDAIMIAFSTQGMVKKLSDYFAKKEAKVEKDKPVLITPIKQFKEAVEQATTLERQESIQTKAGDTITLNRLLISRPPRASVTGAAHEQTAKPYPRIKPIKNKYKRRRIPIDEDKFELFRNDKVASGNDKNFYNSSTIPRVDIYKKDDKYHVVPIYLSDMTKAEVPNKSLGTNPEGMDEKYFCFSVFKNDLIELETKATPKKPSKKLLGYFKQLNGANFILNSIHNGIIDGFVCSPITLFKQQKDMCKKCLPEDRAIGNCSQETLEFWEAENIKVPKKDFECDQGIKFAIAVRKYTIDPLGYYHEVKGEKLLGTIPQGAKKHPKRQK